MTRLTRRTLGALTAGAALSAAAPGFTQQGKVLRFVQNGNLTILDPIWTTAYVTRNHGYFIYDTLFATDGNNAVQPQMVDKYEVSPDKTVWTFTLRDGLEWHDGKPVTSEDCIASIQRWGKRDAMGLKLMDFVKEFKKVDDKTFQMVLKEPYGLVLDSLGKPSSNVPFMMPRRVAETDAFKQIDSQVGSGPFIYVNAESKPGEKHVYSKNPKYKPRAEPASGLAGGKVVKVDRVEIIEMPDPQQQVNALIN
ncbi:MAG: ABC transporter substrate-binding protein, partial [Alphaproteobacteria bacterium]|nr:ABC transporter substrate-binding protein [Alphaproteobacteria bacterium]